MSADTIRIGIIGAGDNTRSRHIPGLRAQDGGEGSHFPFKDEPTPRNYCSLIAFR